MCYLGGDRVRLRNRIVKATTWTDGDLLRWPRDKREFYRSLWACAEDSCCIVDDMFEVKLTAWPSPMDADLTVELLEQWRDELIACGKLVPYEVDGRRYFFIPSMAEHEKPRNPQPPDWPLPPWVTYSMDGEGRNRRCTYTFSYRNGNRSTTVQTASGNRNTVQTTSGNRNTTVHTTSGNRNTSPVLSCPVLSRAEQGKGIDRPSALTDAEQHDASGNADHPTQPSGSPLMPECMTDIRVVNPVSGTSSSMPEAIHSLAQQAWGVMSQRDLYTFTACIRDGCHAGCGKSDAQIDHCYALVKRALTDDRITGRPVRAGAKLLARILAPADKGGDRRLV